MSHTTNSHTLDTLPEGQYYACVVAGKGAHRTESHREFAIDLSGPEPGQFTVNVIQETPETVAETAPQTAAETVVQWTPSEHSKVFDAYVDDDRPTCNRSADVSVIRSLPPNRLTYELGELPSGDYFACVVSGRHSGRTSTVSEFSVGVGTDNASDNASDSEPDLAAAVPEVNNDPQAALSWSLADANDSSFNPDAINLDAAFARDDTASDRRQRGRRRFAVRSIAASDGFFSRMARDTQVRRVRQSA